MKTPLRILHLEDEPHDIEIVRSLLESGGLNCDIAHVNNRSEFEESIDKGEFELILADYSLPSFDGMKALKIAKNKCSEVPFIFVSGTLGEDQAVEAMKAGANDYVMKGKLNRLIPAVKRELNDFEIKKRQKQMEVALLESEQNFRLVCENANDGILIGVDNGQHVYANRKAAQLTGYTIEELLKINMSDLAHPEERLNLKLRYEKRIAGKSAPPQYETKILDKNGIEIPIELTAAKTVWQNKTADLIIFRDIRDRKKQEMALKESEKRLELALESANLGLWDHNFITGRVVRNELWAKMLGYNSDEIGSDVQTWKDIIHPDDLPVVNKLAKKHEAGLTPYFKVEHRLKTKSGEWKWILNWGKVVERDSKNRPVRASGTHIDITDRKIAEEALKESEEKFRSLTAQNLFGIVILQDNVIKYANQAASDTIEYPIETLTKWQWNDLAKLVHPDDQKIMQEQAKKRQKDSRNYIEKYSYRVISKSGKVKWLERYSKPILFGGRYADFITVIDITKRKLVEEALKQSEEKFRNVLENSIDMIYCFNFKSQSFDYVSPSSENILGFSPEECLQLGSKNLFSKIHPLDAQQIQIHYSNLLADKMESNPTKNIECRFNHKKFGYRWISATNSIMYDDTLGAVAMVGNVRDISERKQIEEALRESESFSTSLLVNAPNPIIVINPDTSIRYVNPALQNLTGFSSVELIGRKIPYPWWTEDTFRKGSIELKEASEREPQQSESLFRKKNGIVFWVKINTIAVNSDGSLKYFLYNWVDITKRKNVEEALREKEELLTNILESMSDGILGLDKDYNYTYWNRAMEKISKTPRNTLLNTKKLAWKVFPHLEKQGINELMKRAMSGETVSKDEIPYSLKDGTSGYTSETYVPLKTESGEIRGIVGVIRDITERKEADEALRKSEERFRQIVENSPFPISIAKKGVVEYINPKFTDLFGFQLKDFKKGVKWLAKMFPDPKYRKEILGSWDSRFNKEGGNDLESDTIEITCKDMNTRKIIYHAHTMSDNRVFMVFEDVTDRKIAEAQIKQDLNEKKILLREIHHRVKNNMQVISSLLSLQSRGIDDKRLQELFNESKARVRSMALVHEKLYQSQNLANIQFSEYIKSLAQDLYRSYGSDPGKIILNIKVDNVSLGIDLAIPCGLIINELISNALKHAFPKRLKSKNKIEVIFKKGQEAIELIVKDNGVGVPGKLDFRKTDSLGLHLVRILAEEQLHGTVKLSRKNGTKFSIKFPELKNGATAKVMS